MNYDYNRTASAPSKFARLVGAMAKTLEADLKKGVAQYTGNNRGDAQVKFEGDKLHVRVWMALGESGLNPKGEAFELAEVLIGDGARIEKHALVPDMWVAERYVKL